jgi:hypothetical protein
MNNDAEVFVETKTSYSALSAPELAVKGSQSFPQADPRRDNLTVSQPPQYLIQPIQPQAKLKTVAGRRFGVIQIARRRASTHRLPGLF